MNVEQLMANRPYPFSGFGDDTNTSVKFITITKLHDPIPDWEGGDRNLSDHDIGNGLQVTQRHGWKPWLLTMRLWFEAPGDLALMASLQGEAATLRYRWGLTKQVDGTKQTLVDRDYLVLPDTMLLTLKPVREGGVVTGVPEALATFRRTYVPSPYVGFTVVGADTP